MGGLPSSSGTRVDATPISPPLSPLDKGRDCTLDTSETSHHFSIFQPVKHDALLLMAKVWNSFCHVGGVICRTWFHRAANWVDYGIFTC